MNSPSLVTIKKKVIHNIATISGFKDSDIFEVQDLRVDLGMSDDLRGALAPGFQVIARQTNSAALLTKKECKQLKTVKNSIDLVHKRA